MSQKALEAALGRLLCDDAFRRAFSEDSEVASLHVGLQLTPLELRSLRRIRAEVERFAPHLDDCIRRVEEPPHLNEGHAHEAQTTRKKGGRAGHSR